ncbi:MAG: hypothetical protein NDI69_01480 [Bacteriovoracaceae bacterium]|nr:hypothetical protein [Bacteriovoracaceae bacterium]
MRKLENYQSSNLKGIVSIPAAGKKSMLILLHGVGANEEGLVPVGEAIAPDSVIVSLRAPLILGASSFAWFHVQFTANGPVHNWAEADKSFELLENEIKELSSKYQIPVSNISVMGFSQGSIMTMGLALRSNLPLSRYFCFSGRTLPEFAKFGQEHPEIAKGKKVYLAHGAYDDKLPVQLGRTSKEILENVKADLRYNEFSGGHQISMDVLKDAANWAKSN